MMQNFEFDRLIARLMEGTASPDERRLEGPDLGSAALEQRAFSLLNATQAGRGPYADAQVHWARREVLKHLAAEEAARIAARDDLDLAEVPALREAFEGPDATGAEALLPIAANDREALETEAFEELMPIRLRAGEADAEGDEADLEHLVPYEERIWVNGRPHELFADHSRQCFLLSAGPHTYSSIELHRQRYRLDLEPDGRRYLVQDLAPGDISNVIEAHGHAENSARAV